MGQVKKPKEVSFKESNTSANGDVFLESLISLECQQIIVGLHENCRKLNQRTNEYGKNNARKSS